MSCSLRQLDQLGAPELLHQQMQINSAARCSQQARYVLVPQLLFAGLIVHLPLPASHSLVTRTRTNPSEMAFQQDANSYFSLQESSADLHKLRTCSCP